MLYQVDSISLGNKLIITESYNNVSSELQQELMPGPFRNVHNGFRVANLKAFISSPFSKIMNQDIPGFDNGKTWYLSNICVYWGNNSPYWIK